MKITRLFLFMLMFAISAIALQSTGGSLGAPQDGAESIGGSNSTTCTWYWIECYDGYTDECCGSITSCLTYCEQICNGPCVYTGGEEN